MARDPTAARLFRNLLVPHDFSAQSRAAFALAEPLARLAGARLHLLHVVQAPALHALTPAGPLHLALPDVVVTGALLEAETTLRELAQESRADVRVHVVEGPPTEIICEMAERLPADLIVMGTQGQDGLAHRPLGSVTDRTLRRAPCPVLTVRARYEQSEQPAR
jgi:nucleotide-binding universal stress UspA family protein